MCLLHHNLLRAWDKMFIELGKGECERSSLPPRRIMFIEGSLSVDPCTRGPICARFEQELFAERPRVKCAFGTERADLIDVQLEGCAVKVDEGFGVGYTVNWVAGGEAHAKTDAFVMIVIHNHIIL